VVRSQIAELVANEGKERLVQTEPKDWRFNGMPYLAIQEALHRMRGLPPRSREQVAAIHAPDWEEDIGIVTQLMQFQRHAPE